MQDMYGSLRYVKCASLIINHLDDGNQDYHFAIIVDETNELENN